MSHRLPATESMIRSLVSLPSVSSTEACWDQSNEAVIDQLANWLLPLGFDCNKQAIDGLTGKFNLIATLRGPHCAESGGLLLSGHADTVPFDENAWTHDPFAAQRVDDRVYGLGTADMKSFLAISSKVASSIDPKKLKHPLTILATANEESGMEGARALTRTEVGHAAAAIIGEPTSLQAVSAHKGVLMESIHVQGKAGHSSNPNLGINAIEGMNQVLNALFEFRDQIAQQQVDTRFSVPSTTLNAGCICGGDNPNRIPAHSLLKIDLRVLPGMDNAAVREQLRFHLDSALAGSPYGLSYDVLFDGIPPFESQHDSALLKFVCAESQQEAVAVDFGTEGPFLKDLGLDTIVMGPGNIAQAHQPDEYLDLAQIPGTTLMLNKLIEKYCL